MKRLFEASQWFEKGNQHSLNKEHDSAIEAYTKAIALDPNLAQAYNNRGLASDKKGNTGNAISDFQKACDMWDENGCKALQMALEKR